jgi:nitrogen regulatory protein PII
MQLHRRKKIEIVVQMPIVKQVLDRITPLGATHYTVLTAISGRGHFGEWGLDQLSDATRHVVIVAIVKPELADPILDSVGELFTEYHGIIYVSDVEVRRFDYF